MGINFDLATNFQDELIEQVAPLNAIRNLYGKLREDVVGGGRPNFTLPSVSKSGLKRHIELAKKNRITFNYLLNALCLDNREFISKTNRKIRDLVRLVEDSGAESVTVGSPFMLDLVKANSSLKVSVSIYNDIDSLEKIKKWENLGADELTLHYSYNRNFRKLEEVLRTARVDLRLIANNTCLHECLYRTNHATSLAHASQTGHSTGGFFLDWFSLNCGREKLANPTRLISADWIRPEDVHLYEEVCNKTNSANLSLKLTDRSRPTQWLVNVAKAYASRHYDGNLFDILNFIGNGKYAQVHKGRFILGAIFRKAKPDRMFRFQKAVFLTPAYADNRALDGFMNHFLDYDCSQHVCDDLGWPDSNQIQDGACGYCRAWARKVLKFSDGEKARFASLNECNDLIKNFKEGEI